MAKRLALSPVMAVLFLFLFIVLLSPAAAFRSREPPKWWSTCDPCPTTLKAEMRDMDMYYSSDRRPYPRNPSFSTMYAVDSALRTCPNITILDIRTERPSPYQYDAMLPLSFKGGERYAPTNLTTLRLRGYNFAHRQICGVAPPIWNFDYGCRRYDSFWDWLTGYRMRQYFRDFYSLPESQKNKTNIDLWLDAMDFSHVETLVVMGEDWRMKGGMNHEILKLLSQLPSLRHLQLEGVNASELFLSLPRDSLQSITWSSPGRSSSLKDIVAHHSASLKSLAFHTGTDPDDDRTDRATPSMTELNFVVSHAPILETLTIDLSRNATAGWPLDALKSIARLPRLRNLTVHFDLISPCGFVEHYYWDEDRDRPWSEPHCNGRCFTEDHFQFAKPALNMTEAEAMWNLVKEERQNLGLDDLEEMLVWIGDASQEWKGHLYVARGFEGASAYMRCSSKANEKGQRCVGSGHDHGLETYSGDFCSFQDRQKLRLLKGEPLEEERPTEYEYEYEDDVWVEPIRLVKQEMEH